MQNLPEGLYQVDQETPQTQQTGLPEGLYPIEPAFDATTARQKRIKEVSQTFEDYSKGDINTGELVLQTVGKGAFGMTADYLAEGFGAIFKGLDYILPDLPQDMKDKAGNTVSMLLDTEVGQVATQALKNGYEGWENFRQTHPQAAKDIESVVNIAALLPPSPKGLNKLILPTLGSGKAGTALIDSANATIDQKNARYLYDFLIPEDAQKMSQTREGGLLRQAEFIPDPQQRKMVNTVRTEAGVDYSRSDIFNANQIQSAKDKVKRRVEAIYAGNNVSIDWTTSSQKLIDDVNNFRSTNSQIVSDTTLNNTVDLHLTKALDILASHPKNALGVFRARQEFDRVMQEQNLNLYGGAKTVTKAMNKVVRNSINELLDARVPKAKQERLKHSDLITATNSANQSAVGTGKDAISRTLNTLRHAGVDIRRHMTDLSTVVGAGAAAAVFSSTLPVYAGGTLLAINNLKSPKGRKLLGNLLVSIDKGIKKIQDSGVIEQLRADRVILMDMLKQPMEGQQQEQMQ